MLPYDFNPLAILSDLSDDELINIIQVGQLEKLCVGITIDYMNWNNAQKNKKYD